MAFASAPRRSAPDLFFDVGDPFFPDFTDPEAAATLEVMDFDEETASATPFQVTNQGGLWTIPVPPRLPGRRRRAAGQHRRGYHQPRQGGLPLGQHCRPRGARGHRPVRPDYVQPRRPRHPRDGSGHEHRDPRRPRRRQPGPEPARSALRADAGAEARLHGPLRGEHLHPLRGLDRAETCWRSSATR